MGGAYSEELLKLYIGKGMKLMLAGNDLPMLTNAARTHQAKVRGCMQEEDVCGSAASSSLMTARAGGRAPATASLRSRSRSGAACRT